MDALTAIRTTEWSNIPSNIGAGFGQLKAKFTPAVEEAVDQTRQV